MYFFVIFSFNELLVGEDMTKSREENFAIYIIENNTTIRKCAEHFGCSKSTVHNDISKKLKMRNRFLYYRVYMVLNRNFAERHIRGGNATRQKYTLLHT